MSALASASGARQVHVVAAVISDGRGRILLARRTVGRDLAGAWEFPGGKVEPGESALAALERELNEELGIRIHAAHPLIAVPHAYPGKRILLDVHRVATYDGLPRGLEGQALAWVPPHKLPGYAMPPADRPVVAALSAPGHYLVTPDPREFPSDFLARLGRALQSGLRRVQLRAPGMDGPAFACLAESVDALCRAHGAELLVNGDIALAQRLGVGVHLRAVQLSVLEARPLPAGQPVAASCHDQRELELAAALGADFVVLGPVAATASHPGAPAMGWLGFSRLRESTDLPIYAIGGLAGTDFQAARQHGAQGIAAIRGFWPA